MLRVLLLPLHLLLSTDLPLLHNTFSLLPLQFQVSGIKKRAIPKSESKKKIDCCLSLSFSIFRLYHTSSISFSSLASQIIFFLISLSYSYFLALSFPYPSPSPISLSNWKFIALETNSIDTIKY
jgi:hypothetical protein